MILKTTEANRRLTKSELIVGALRNPHLRVFEELFSDFEDWSSQDREELLAYLRAKRTVRLKNWCVATRVPAKPFQDCDVYHGHNLKGFSRSLYLPAKNLKKMACHLMAFFHLPEFRNLFPANLLCIRASGVEWTARRRVLRTWDVSAQHYPAPYAFRIRNRYG